MFAQLLAQPCSCRMATSKRRGCLLYRFRSEMIGKEFNYIVDNIELSIRIS